MKRTILVLLLIFQYLSATTQTGNIGIGTNTPENSAILDMTSSDKGVLIPRMSSSMRTNIPNPANGLMVYDTTTNSFWYYQSFEWAEIGGGNPVFKQSDGVVRTITKSNDDFIFGDTILPTGFDIENMFFFDRDKAAFRAGRISNNLSWVPDSIGLYSFAAGQNTLASGPESTAFGRLSKARGQSSVALGRLAIADGGFSFASGNSSKALGEYSIAMGNQAQAIGDNSLSLGALAKSDEIFSNSIGYYAEASGKFSNAFGSSSNAIGDFSTSISSSTASGLSSLAMGSGAEAIGENSVALIGADAIGKNSVAMGLGTEAKGEFSTSMGYLTDAESRYSLATGNKTVARGENSTAFGRETSSDAYLAVALGRFNKGGGDSIAWSGTDPLFEVGIGFNASNKENAMTVYKNGQVAFKDYSFPINDGANLQTLATDGLGNLNWTNNTGIFEVDNGIVRSSGLATDDFLFGSQELPGIIATTDNFMFFDKSLSAFRVGALDNSYAWNETDIGQYSFATGLNTEASGTYSAAFGQGSQALNSHSFAFGLNAKANAIGAFAVGELSEATAEKAIAMGDSCLADGYHSLSMGHFARALGAYSVAIGRKAKATGNTSLALGLSTEATGLYSTAMGKGTHAVGESSIAAGDGGFANGDYSVILGKSNTADGDYSVAVGGSNLTSGDYSFAGGNDNFVAGQNGAALGLGNSVVSFSSFSIGRYNYDYGNPTDWIETDPIFTIGNGTSLLAVDRSNLLTVYKSGLVEITDSLHTDGNLNVGSGLGSRIYLGNTMMQSGGPSILRMDTNIRPFDDNTYDLGSSGKRWEDIYSTNGVTQTSDKRLKKDITPLKYGLKDLMNIETVDYRWNTDGDHAEKHLGLIAQNLMDIVPEVVNQPKEEEEFLGVNYAELIPVLIKSIQEQQKMIDSLQKEVESLKGN